MSEQRFRQLELRADQSKLMCWVEDDRRLRPHVRITLKEIPKVVWEIAWMSEITITQHPRKTWRVGGL